MLGHETDDSEYALLAELVENDEDVPVPMHNRYSGLKFLVVSFGQELDYAIPSFPVLTINFQNLGLDVTGKKCNGLVNQKDCQSTRQAFLPRGHL